MAPIRVGVDLGQSPIRVGALLLSKYIVAEGSKDIKVNGAEVPTKHQVVEIFRHVNDVVKSFFGAPNFQAAVVVVPNSTSPDNQHAVTAGGATYNIMEIIPESTAVAAAYAYKIKPTQTKRLAIISLTAGELAVSIYSIDSDTIFFLETSETHPEPIDFAEPSRPGGLIGLVGGAVKAAVVDPFDKAFDILKKLLSNPKFTESPADEVVFVGKAAKSEKLKQAVAERFPNAGIWSPEDIKPEELAAYGAAVIAFKQLTRGKREPVSIGRRRGGVLEDDDPLSQFKKLDDAINGSATGLLGPEFAVDDDIN